MWVISCGLLAVDWVDEYYLPARPQLLLERIVECLEAGNGLLFMQTQARTLEPEQSYPVCLV